MSTYSLEGIAGQFLPPRGAAALPHKPSILLPIKMNPAVLTKRLPREIAEAQSDALKATGIYFWYDEADMRNGKALILGPEGTPYAHCPLLFHLRLPNDYPHTNPGVTFMTSDGATRFHPNLYVQGKVCLSILGTWAGPPWSAIMNISKVLVTIQSLLEANPIVNEPSYEKYTLADPLAKHYAEFVHARLVSHSFSALLRWKQGHCPPEWEEFKDVLDGGLGDTLLQKLLAEIQAQAEKGEQVYTGIVYSMGGKTNWGTLLKLAKAAKLEGA